MLEHGASARLETCQHGIAQQGRQRILGHSLAERAHVERLERAHGAAPEALAGRESVVITSNTFSLCASMKKTFFGSLK